MEVSARVFAAICILCSTLSPLASASFTSELYEFFSHPVKPPTEPWLINDDGYSKSKQPPKHSKSKQPPKHSKSKQPHRRLGNLHPIGLGLRTTEIFGVGVQISVNEEPLHAGFYDKTCPRAEQIVTDVVTKAVQNESEVAARLLRLHFHDCFVNGCDASLLLDKTPSGEKTEKLALPNFTLRGFEVIDAVKSELEKECPGVVSCADTLAFAARDALVLSGFPSYTVLSGRRDARASREADVLDNLPEASDPIDKTLKVVERKGLTVEDLVVLQGAHSIGVAHCRNFAYRLEKPNGEKELDLQLVTDIKATCPTNRTRKTMSMDRATQYKMDADFYKQLLEKKGLLESDVIMVNDPKTSYLVKKLAADQGLWFEKFVTSMIRMGNIGVLTGTQGEIRKICTSVN